MLIGVGATPMKTGCGCSDSEGWATGPHLRPCEDDDPYPGRLFLGFGMTAVWGGDFRMSNSQSAVHSQ